MRVAVSAWGVVAVVPQQLDTCSSTGPQQPLLWRATAAYPDFTTSCTRSLSMTASDS
jgi:hypothetical protein